ncbi:MAG: hypothetical protein J2P50_04810 [Hyphomicrobiaceae bacterium]|nr:hypothetical protein [Hyphomicrobiaceae bacterium]
MRSESTRASSAAESRYRIDAPNFRPRTVKVVALDRPSEVLAARLEQDHWDGAMFLTASAFSARPPVGASFSVQAWLSDLSGRTRHLLEEIAGADQVVMIACAGQSVPAAGIIGEACSLKRVATTALIIGGDAASDAALSRTLAQLRPWALMLVVAGSDAYVADMLRALRA